MNDITITAAPQACITESLYEKWMETHTGTQDDFIGFMMTPSIERNLFLDSIECEVDIKEGIGTATYRI